MDSRIKQTETGKSIFKNVLYGFSTWLLPLGLSFVATPIIVRSLGNEVYGIYALVLGFIAYSFNFSIGRAITKYIAEYSAAGKKEFIRDLISAAFFLNLGVGVIGVLVLIFSSRWLVTDVFRIDAEYEQISIYSLYIAAALIFVAMLTQIFNAVLQGMHRFDVYSKIYNLNGISLIVGNIYLALNGYGVLALLWWNLAISSITCVVYAVSAWRLLPEFGINFVFPVNVFRLVLSFSFGVIGYQILANLLLLFERGWITRRLGPESLTFYVVPMTLSLLMHGFISSLSLVLFPLASELQDNKEKLLRLYTKATKIVCLLVVFIGLTFVFQSHELLTVWIGADFADNSYDLLIVHTVTFGLVAIQIVSWQMTEGLGFPGFNFKVFSICLITSVTLMFFLIDDFGGIGVAFARLAGFGGIFLFVFYVEKWFFESVQYRMWLRIMATLSVSGALGVLVERLVMLSLPLTWFSLFLAVFCGGVVYCGVVWLAGYVSEDEKLLLKGLIKR
ncbi:MAG: oligosaccharide flippase family protein [Acidobacteriota bacterium]|nr:oligosaccharide flippase family protein [Acidobacteriota bacterium]